MPRRHLPLVRTALAAAALATTLAAVAAPPRAATPKPVPPPLPVEVLTDGATLAGAGSGRI